MRPVSYQLGLGIACLAAVLLPAVPASGQVPSNGWGLQNSGASTDTGSATLLTPMFSAERITPTTDFPLLSQSDSLNINLGLELKPANGLNVRADAWRLDVSENPSNSLSGAGWTSQLPGFLRDTQTAVERDVPMPLLTSGVQTNGIDLGASYVFETNEAGQFTLSTKATYVYDFRQAPALLEASPLSGNELPGNPDLQGNLTLTWDFGNHSASATTNYFDSFKNLSELNLEEINRLVDDIVTFDLQYGYSIKTGKLERAEFSFGIRNIFDKKTTQILNSNSRVLDQNGRVAYGSVKYQF